MKVELIHANPGYAHVKLPDGKETTVSLRHLAPPGKRYGNCDPRNEEETDMSTLNEPVKSTQPFESLDIHTNSEMSPNEDNTFDSQNRPRRTRTLPKYLDDYVTN